MMTDLLGRERYRLDRSLGVGAMGTVYLARDTILDRVVAIKVLADHLAADDAFRHRFVREARISAGLCHANIVQVFDAGDDDDGRPFLVMEYVEGETVAERLARHQAFSGDELVGLMTQLSAGLAHAHAEGIVHRDVKPHNVLLRTDGVAKLMDFGIARALTDRGLTEIGTVLGTAAYMAPEQAAGQPVGPAADVYALGALVRHTADGPLPPALDGLVEAALAPDPAARPSAAEMHRRLAALSDAPTEIAAPAPRPVAEAAPTEVRSASATELMPPADSWVTTSWRRLTMPSIAMVVGLVILFLLAVQLAGSGRKPAADTPATATTTTTESAAAPPAVPTPADPSRAARDLADWLRAQVR